MPELEIYITSRDGSVNRRMFQYSDAQLIVPLNDAREFRFSCPIYDINSLGQSNTHHFLPLRRQVKVFYNDRLVFHGPIVKPIFNGGENKVEVNCADPSFWLKRHAIHDGDDALDPGGFGVDSMGLVTLLFSGYLTTAEAAAGYAQLPITWGPDVNDYASIRNIAPHRGELIWDIWMDMVEAFDGPDFEFRPIDANHDLNAIYTPGDMVELRACQKVMPPDTSLLQSDLTDSVQFHFNFGRTNLGNFIYEPDANNLINRFTAENSNQTIIRVARYGDSIQQDGIVETWEQASQGVDADGLGEWAKGYVTAYGEVPKTFTIEPTWDMGLMGSAASTPWRYPTGFQVGDRIRGVTRQGNLELDLTGRITKVTLSQLNEAENVASQIEIIPDTVEVSGIVVDDTPEP